ATVLFALGIGWVLSTRPPKPPVDARKPARREAPQEAAQNPLAPPVQQVAQNSDTSSTTGPGFPVGKQSPSSGDRTSAVSTVVVDVLLSTLRDESKPEAYTLDRGKKTATLRFIFSEAPAARRFTLHLTDGQGKKIQTWKEIKPMPVQGDMALIVVVPMEELPAGLYTVSIDPIPPEADIEVVKDFVIDSSLR